MQMEVESDEMATFLPFVIRSGNFNCTPSRGNEVSRWGAQPLAVGGILPSTLRFAEGKMPSAAGEPIDRLANRSPPRQTRYPTRDKSVR